MNPKDHPHTSKADIAESKALEEKAQAVVFPPETPMSHQDVERFFAYAQFPENLHNLGREFFDVAMVIESLPVGTERTAALRRLLESRDAAIRAAAVISPPLTTPAK